MVASSKNMVIGKNNNLPWKLKEDTEYYQNMVNDQICIYGRKTFDHSPKKLIDNRINIVITSSIINDEKNIFYTTIENVYLLLNNVHKIHPNKKIFILGGENIYKYFLPKCKFLYFTMIDKYYDGNIFFPYYSGYNIIEYSKKYYSTECECEYQFQIFENNFNNTKIEDYNTDNVKLY